MMDAARGSAAVVGALLIVAGALRWLGQTEPITLPRATSDGAVVQVLTASLPGVPAFAEVDINQSNPFLPRHLRGTPAVSTARRPIADPRGDSDTAAPDPADVPVWSLPPRSTSAATPTCVGLIAHARGRSLLVRMAHTAVGLPMAVGDEVDGWRLEAIDLGIARWRAPDGALRDLVIAAVDD